MPEIENAVANTTEARYVTDVMLTCVTGYVWNTSVDYIIITCQNDATWSDEVYVTAAQCIRKR